MKKPVTIQVNASGKGLGAALIQDDGPVTFTSKALTPMEQCHAKNERELLPCVLDAACFQTYVFSRHFMIKSDHKLLEQISMNNLVDAERLEECAAKSAANHGHTSCHKKASLFAGQTVYRSGLEFGKWDKESFKLDTCNWNH